MTQPPPNRPPSPNPYGGPPTPPPQPYGTPYPGHGQGHQQPYRAPHHPQPAQGWGPPQPVPQAYPGPPGAVVACRICGGAPASEATFRGVVGALVMHTWWTARGPFCRYCGLSTFRAQTAKTLAGGWCSIGALVLAPIFLLLNVVGRGKVVNLPAPQRYQVGPSPTPLDPGPPLFQRPAAYLFPIIVFGFLVLVVVSNLSR